MKKLVLHVVLVLIICSLVLVLPTVAAVNGKIAFTSNRDGDYKIYVMNPDGSGQTRLTNSLPDYNPAWSPDGKKIAFAEDVLARTGEYPDIYVMNADGSGKVRLTTNPDFDNNPAWSPDGKKIAFDSWRNSNTREDIFVMNADGTGQTRLTTNAADDIEPAWSPDGKKIAFYSDRNPSGIYIMNADGSGQTWLSGGYDPAWSPDGKKIAFVSISGGLDTIYVMNADGTGKTRLTYLAHSSRPAWSPDGTKITFMDLIPYGTSDIWLIKADGSGQTRLTTNAADDESPSWGPASITVTAPNGGENWVRGTAHKITWTQTGLTGTNVKVDLLTYSPIITFPPHLPSSSPIVSSVPASQGYYYWTPPIIPPGPPYAIYHPYGVKVTSLSSPTLSDTSDKTFDLSNPSAASFTVTSPTCGDTWQPGTTHSVKWSYTGNPGSYVKVVLMKAGVDVGTATYSTSIGSGGTGSYPWAISSGRAPGTDYQIRVESTSNPSVKGTSCKFTIGAPPASSIKVTVPNGGESWKRGTTQTVRWSYTGNPGAYVKVVLMKAGVDVGTATYSTATATGSYPWAISSTRAPGTDYKIRVESVSNPTIKDTTDGYLTITA